MYWKLEGVNVGFLMQITGQREARQKEGTWRCVAVEKVLNTEGTQYLGAYIDRWQAKVSEWVVLCPILEVYNKEICYKIWRRRQDHWWRQKATRKTLSARLNRF